MHVAVKTVPDHATFRQRIEFLNEASVMKVSVKEVPTVLARDQLESSGYISIGIPWNSTEGTHMPHFPACALTKKDIISFLRYELLLCKISKYVKQFELQMCFFKEHHKLPSNLRILQVKPLFSYKRNQAAIACSL